MKTIYGETYYFDDCGMTVTGTYHSTLNHPFLKEKYHVMMVGSGSDFMPILVSESRFLNTEQAELRNILKETSKTHLYESILDWHNKHKK